MLDLHNHMLPGLDDGPSSMEETLEMARLAYEDGVRTIVATPHGRDVAEKSSLSAVRALVDQLKGELRTRSVPLKVLLGMENHLEMDTPEQVERGLAIPIEGTHYILLELPFPSYPLYTEEVLFKLQIKGLHPIIVHPERNAPIQENPQVLAGLVQKGALAQLTASSITGAFGRDTQRVSRELLRRGLVHIIASDGHDARGNREPILSTGVAAAARVVGKEASLRMVVDIPQAILQDVKLDPEELARASGKKRWPLRR
ncbi:MAG: tyrosine protein phosphatase [Dehalococcoidia bacterium]|nr:tyrosine protein phosphatase [Dehalococcoidia bacterium]